MASALRPTFWDLVSPSRSHHLWSRVSRPFETFLNLQQFISITGSGNSDGCRAGRWRTITRTEQESSSFTLRPLSEFDRQRSGNRFQEARTRTDAIQRSYKQWNFYWRWQQPILPYTDTYASLRPLFSRVFFCTPATSAPVERVFSRSELIMRPNRAKMVDSMLESLVFLKCNAANASL